MEIILLYLHTISKCCIQTGFSINKLLKLLIFFDKTNLYRSILAIGWCVLLTFSSLTICLPATALLRQHHETPNVLRYHARDSLKDSDGNTWQVVLFPETSQSNTTYYLRLVGFPEINSFTHPQSLEILTWTNTKRFFQNLLNTCNAKGRFF